MKVFLFFLLVPYIGLTQDCDIIILNEGTEISSIVEEIRLTEIAYKKCDNPNGPLYIVSKNDVFMIKYKNGSKELISQTNKTSNSANKTNSIKYFRDLSLEEKNKILESQTCFKVVPKPSKGEEFKASISQIKKISILFKFCDKSGGNLMNNIYIDYIESEQGERIYFNKE